MYFWDDGSDTLPKGSNVVNKDGEKVEEQDQPQEEAVPEETEGDRLRDFFFPKKEPDKYGPKCECGLEYSSVGGNHSTWCSKYRK